MIEICPSRSSSPCKYVDVTCPQLWARSLQACTMGKSTFYAMIRYSLPPRALARRLKHLLHSVSHFLWLYPPVENHPVSCGGAHALCVLWTEELVGLARAGDGCHPQIALADQTIQVLCVCVPSRRILGSCTRHQAAVSIEASFETYRTKWVSKSSSEHRALTYRLMASMGHTDMLVHTGI